MTSTTITSTHHSQLNLLKNHFSGMGVLSGTDLLSGKSYERIYPEDTFDFFKAHLLGPGRYAATTGVVAEDHLDELHQVSSFFRCQCRSLDDDGMTSAISLTVKGQQGLEPTSEVYSIIEQLQHAGWPVLIERSFRLLRWTLWTLLTNRVAESAAKDIAYRQYCLVRDRNLIAGHLVEVPLIDETVDRPYLPFQFFSGDFYGMLYQLNGHQLQQLDFHSVPHFDAFSGRNVSCSFVCDEMKQSIEALFKAWWKRFNQHRIRAGELLKVLDDEGISIDPLIPPGEFHRRSIELGQFLKSSEDQFFCGKKMYSRRSGNGTVFWLVESSEQSSCDDSII